MTPDQQPSALIQAVMDGNAVALRQQLKQAPQWLNQPVREGLLLLHIAASYGKITAIATLLDLGADINFADPDGQTALHYAATPQVADQLLLAGASVEVRDAQFERTPLHTTTDYEVAAVFVAAGLDVNVRDRYGRTPLHIAAADGNKALVQFLLDAQADFTLRDKQGKTPLHLAASYHHNDIVEQLRQRGAVLESPAPPDVTVDAPPPSPALTPRMFGLDGPPARAAVAPPPATTPTAAQLGRAVANVGEDYQSNADMLAELSRQKSPKHAAAPKPAPKPKPAPQQPPPPKSARQRAEAREEVSESQARMRLWMGLALGLLLGYGISAYRPPTGLVDTPSAMPAMLSQHMLEHPIENAQLGTLKNGLPWKMSFRVPHPLMDVTTVIEPGECVVSSSACKMFVHIYRAAKEQDTIYGVELTVDAEGQAGTVNQENLDAIARDSFLAVMKLPPFTPDREQITAWLRSVLPHTHTASFTKVAVTPTKRYTCYGSPWTRTLEISHF